MSTTSRPRIKSQAVIDKCQVEIVDLKGTYVRSAGTKSAAILDGTKLCRVEEFAARHFRRSGFEAIRLLRRDAIPLLAHFDSGPSSLIGRANVLVQSKKVARVEFGLELPQPFERLRIICGLHAIRALVTKEI